VKYLKITFAKGSNYWIGICEIFTFAYKNYLPSSTLSYWYPASLDSDSYDVLHSSGPTFFSTAKMSGSARNRNYYFDSNYHSYHTCNYLPQNNVPSTYLFTLPLYLEIKEFYFQGDESMKIYLGDPLSITT